MIRPAKHLGGKIFQASLAVALTSLPFLVGAVVFTKASQAMACKDCTFPLHIGDNKWVMPNGQLQIEIQEDYNHVEDSVEVQVWLRDAHTNELLAAGHATRAKFKTNFQVKLDDRGGTQVRGEIRWVNKKSEVIQARFACVNTCTISRFFD